MTRSDRLPFALLAGVALALTVSAIRPADGPTWAMETAPIFIAAPVLIATHRRFPLSHLLCVLIALHALVLMVGGHYTYARVPLGSWAQQAFHLARNHFDRLGHFAQGFIPAIAVRELLLRLTPLGRGGWLFTLVCAVCLAISACYEFVEWWTALLLGSGADEFLATQGDVWDTQWDMFMALLGAVLAQLVLARWHDAQLEHLPGEHQTGDWHRWKP